MDKEQKVKRFFILNFSIIVVLCLVLFLWFSWLEWNYQLLNFIQLKTPFHITSKQVLRQYLVAMEKGHYSTAYDYLSQESRARHSFEEFVNSLKDGMTQFSKRHFWQVRKQDKKLVLGIALYEDPASWGFELRHENKWKIVWEKGRPFFPYPDNYACGIPEQ